MKQQEGLGGIGKGRHKWAFYPGDTVISKRRAEEFLKECCPIVEIGNIQFYIMIK